MLKQTPEQIKAWEKQLYDNAGFLKYAHRFEMPIRGILEPLAQSLEQMAAEMRKVLEQ